MPPSRWARSSIEVSPSRRERSSGSAGRSPRRRRLTSSTSRPSRRPSRTPRCAGAGVADGVLQRLLGDAQDLAVARARRRPRASSISTSISTRCSRRSISTCLRSAPHSPSRSSSGGRSSRISERSSSSASRASARSRSTCARARRRVAVELRAGRLGGEHEAEQLLADRVVELEREPVARLEHRQLAAALVEAGVGDRDRRVRGEQLDHRLVGGVERLRRPPSRSGRRRRSRPPARRSARRGTSACRGARDGHQPRKRGCAWMSSVRYGSARLEHRAEHPVPARERAERGDQLVAHPRHEEAGEAALAVRRAERRVAGAGQLARASGRAAAARPRPSAARRPPGRRR